MSRTMSVLPEMAGPVENDLADAVERIAPGLADELRGAHLLITGGTGFLGSWLVDLLLRLEQRYTLGLCLTLLTRSASAVVQRRPDWLEAPGLGLIEGDVRHFSIGDARFTHLVHAATDVSRIRQSPLELADSIIGGSRHVLDIAACGGVRRYLYFSSGAVLGSLDRTGSVDENLRLAPPVDAVDAYPNAKRYAEHLHLLAAREFGFELMIARGFAFAGPRMPLDKFAIGNFICDAARGHAPRLNSAGLAERSYLYAADAAVWLLSLLAYGRTGQIYNVGSDQAVRLRDLAGRVAEILGSPAPLIPDASEGETASSYVPDVSRARDELGLVPEVGLDEIIRRTTGWAADAGLLGAQETWR